MTEQRCILHNSYPYEWVITGQVGIPVKKASRTAAKAAAVPL